MPSLDSLMSDPVLAVRPGLLLWPVAPVHASAIFALVETNRTHLREWLPWLDGCRSEIDQRAFIDAAVLRRQAGRGAVWLVEEAGVIRGVAGFNWIDPETRAGEIGYWLTESAQGRGVMTACARRLVDCAFDQLRLTRVTIPVAVENSRSRRLVERLGFREEKVLPQAEWLYDHFVDHVVYAMNRPSTGTTMSSGEVPAE